MIDNLNGGCPGSVTSASSTSIILGFLLHRSNSQVCVGGYQLETERAENTPPLEATSTLHWLFMEIYCPWKRHLVFRYCLGPLRLP